MVDEGGQGKADEDPGAHGAGAPDLRALTKWLLFELAHRELPVADVADAVERARHAYHRGARMPAVLEVLAEKLVLELTGPDEPLGPEGIYNEPKG